MQKKTSRLSVSASIAAAAMLSACGGGGGAGSGTLHVSLTDAPSCGFDQVNVTVSKVRIHRSASASENDAGWTDITLNPARKINLLDLTNGALTELGQTPLPAGHYTQLRLVLDPNTGNGTANSVVLSTTPANTTELPLFTPSAVQSGIKLVNAFDVAADQRADLVLDFDACKSVVTRGNGSFALKPVVKTIPTVLNGIDGFVDPALLGSHVTVSAQQNGVVVRSTVPNASTGEFFLARLDPGTYDVVVTADNKATAVIASVPVASTTSTVVVSNAGAPISLPADATPRTISGTAVLNPPSSTEVAFVAAKQSFASGPTVTVKYQGADLNTGAYSLTLPTAAPLFGTFGSLPITLTAATAQAGKYSASASALGYVTQTTATDISSASVLQNFTLVP